VWNGTHRSLAKAEDATCGGGLERAPPSPFVPSAPPFLDPVPCTAPLIAFLVPLYRCRLRW
jgi:hypothetical protein